MAITITQERKKQRYLILALAAIIFAILGIIWLIFLQARQQPSEPSLVLGAIYAVPKVEIDWQVLEDLRGQAARPLEKISAFEGKFGRKNPFIPY